MNRTDAHDASQTQRPGVPMERRPAPAGQPSWSEPERQPHRPGLTRRVELDRMTPVFGTAQPPRGLAGALRRIAYQIPEHKARHWMTLLMADRVDAYGYRLKKLSAWALPLVALWLIRRET